MIKLSQDRTRRLVAIHGWSAVVFGLFLYVVILTGAVAVLAHEIGAWSVGGAKVAEPMASPLDVALRKHVLGVPEEQREDVSIFENAAGNILAFFHTHQKNPESGKVEDYGSLLVIDPRNGDLVASHEGYAADVFPADSTRALDHFIVDLHVSLHAPDPWGLYATGILGLVMLVAAVSGLLIHRHLIKDAFVAPRPNGALLEKKDKHVLAGTWGLVFGFVLAFTGSFFSFAGALGLPLVAVTAFNGDQVAMIETLVGHPDADNPTPTSLGNLDAMRARSVQEAGNIPTFISVTHWGRGDAQVQIFHPPVSGHLNGNTHVFHGASGEYIGTKPSLGTVPSAGSAAFDLMGPLHFGNFAGLISKFVWVSLGLAMCYLTISGMQLWLERRKENPAWQRLARIVDIVGYGTPIGLVGAAYGFFLSYDRTDPNGWTASGFIVFSILSIVLGLLLKEQTLKRALTGILGALTLFLPVIRIVMGGPLWHDALQINSIVVGMDLLMFITGGYYCFVALGSEWIAKIPGFRAITFIKKERAPT